MPQAIYHDTAIDHLGSRIDQITGVVNAIQNSYDDPTGYTMPDDYLRKALDAVVELLDQAKASFDALVDESIAERAKKEPANGR